MQTLTNHLHLNRPGQGRRTSRQVWCLLIGLASALAAPAASAATITANASIAVSVEVRSTCQVGATETPGSNVQCSMPVNYATQMQSGSVILASDDDQRLVASDDGRTLVITY